jgi:thiamine-phosphate pyrophosphorylase
MAWEAGECAVQYRNKVWNRGRDLREALEISALSEQSGNCLIVNDRIALAFELRARGVHLGKGDGDPAEAADVLGPDTIIGVTVHSMEELKALSHAKIDYIGVGPVFGTRSKEIGLPDLGLDGLAEIAHSSPWPVIGIGGIGPRQVAAVISAGAYGVAVVSAFCHSPDPVRVGRDILEQLARA